METFNDQRPYVGAAMFFERLADGGWTVDDDGFPQRADRNSASGLEKQESRSRYPRLWFWRFLL